MVAAEGEFALSLLLALHASGLNGSSRNQLEIHPDHLDPVLAG
jgi:hypothetical protein